MTNPTPEPTDAELVAEARATEAHLARLIGFVRAASPARTRGERDDGRF